MKHDEKRSNAEPKGKPEERADKAAVGTEAARTGGIEPAKRQAQKDWENSAKESGE